MENPVVVEHLNMLSISVIFEGDNKLNIAVSFEEKANITQEIAEVMKLI